MVRIDRERNRLPRGLKGQNYGHKKYLVLRKEVGKMGRLGGHDYEYFANDNYETLRSINLGS